jgi:hypothetical protein
MTRRSTYGPGLNVVCQLQIFVFMLAWIPVVCSAAAQDADLIKPFGLLDFDARLDLRYNLDDRSRSFESDAGSFETRTTWEEELSLSARAFIYHPGFLNMEFTGGPLLVQQEWWSRQQQRYSAQYYGPAEFLGTQELSVLDILWS